MQYTLPFSKINKSNANSAGGKGASLGEMTRVGIPVPEGFVILANTFEQFIKETKLEEKINSILKFVDHTDSVSVDAASLKIKNLILSKEIPNELRLEIESSFSLLDSPFVAVRSSATAEDGAEHAWAGQLESYLNTAESDLLENVKQCWVSLYSPRAIFYRFEKGLQTTQISVAVVIQKMIDSEISGIAFSVHPVTENRNQLIIEAAWGLGEAIVSGAITPDSYVVEKEPKKIIDINISSKTRELVKNPTGGNHWINIEEPRASSQVLNESQILELSELIIKIEEHYGFPCDIEWAFEAEKFYIVQSRPITTLSNII